MFVINYVILLLSSLCFVYALENSPDILIIGAGASGIAAATKLWKANFTNIKILEAENRIGGRINSVTFGDALIDLGAEWCPDENNIVYDLVKQYNILKATKFSTKAIYSNGTYMDQDVYRNLMEFTKSASKYGTKIDLTCEKSTCLIGRYKNDPVKLNISLDAIDWLESFVQSSATALPLYLPLNWNGLGFKTILDVMLQKYPDPTKALPLINNILLNKDVSKITWKNSSTAKISVRCKDNSVYEADHVIFTPSLGVLKNSHEKMFIPELPKEKIDAIKLLGFGAEIKMALRFPKTWWNTEEAYEFIWSADDKKKMLSEFGKGPIKNGKSWLTTSVVFLTAENNSKVLIGFFSGDMAAQIEAEDDQVLLDGCMYMLRKFLGRKFSVVNADGIMKSVWYTNPHFQGTFTYKPTAGNDSYTDRLVVPLKQENGNPAVLFAGEATHSNSSTVHGAIETGYREADRIIQFYKHKDM